MQQYTVSMAVYPVQKPDINRCICSNRDTAGILCRVLRLDGYHFKSHVGYKLINQRSFISIPKLRGLIPNLWRKKLYSVHCTVEGCVILVFILSTV